MALPMREDSVEKIARRIAQFRRPSVLTLIAREATRTSEKFFREGGNSFIAQSQPTRYMYPWVLAQVARLSLERGTESGKDISWWELYQIHSRLLGIPRLVSGGDVPGMASALIEEQLRSWDIGYIEGLRTLAILDRTPGTTIPEVWQENYGASFSDGLAIATGLGFLAAENSGRVSDQDLRHLGWHPPAAREHKSFMGIVGALGTTPAEFRALSRGSEVNLPIRDDHFARFNHLESLPMVNIGGERFAPVPSWIPGALGPVAFQYRMRKLMDSGVFGSLFGEGFESYVQEHFDLVGGAITARDVPDRKHKKRIDLWVDLGEVVLMVEVKSTASNAAERGGVYGVGAGRLKAVRHAADQISERRAEAEALGNAPVDIGGKPIVGLIVFPSYVTLSIELAVDPGPESPEDRIFLASVSEIESLSTLTASELSVELLSLLGSPSGSIRGITQKHGNAESPILQKVKSEFFRKYDSVL